MIEKIEFFKYKKLENLELSLGSGVISIMGTNGTCKSSLLHIISNSYQAFELNSGYFDDSKCIKIIKSINQMVNPKIETLNKGDRKYNNPAPKYSGHYYQCTYSNGQTLKFRKHNQKDSNRYRVIPKYDSKTNEKLPYGLVIYLGLGRLNAYGEYQDDGSISRINSKLILPEKYQNELLKTYKSFTRYDINEMNYEKMGDLKKRGEFATAFMGSDSNTISAGEDNLMIILTALYSLKYFAESLKNEYKNLPGILLIDELDATLHPEYQTRLLALFNEICIDYKNLNIVFTTHSISILQECNRNKNKIIYLTDNITKVGQMVEPDEFKIKAALENKLGRDYYSNRQIPILTEDKEARDFLTAIIDYLKITEPYSTQCSVALQHIKLVDSTFSSESLKKLFVESQIDRQNLQMIGIVDGDKKPSPTYSLIALPGKNSPEKIVFDICLSLKMRQDEPEVKTLLTRLIDEHSCTMKYIEDNIVADIQKIETKMSMDKEQGKSTHGLLRTLNKNLYEKYSSIFIDIFKFWVKDKNNSNELNKFYYDLRSCFKQNAPYYGLDQNIWKNESIDSNENTPKQLGLNFDEKQILYDELQEDIEKSLLKVEV